MRNYLERFIGAPASSPHTAAVPLCPSRTGALGVFAAVAAVHAALGWALLRVDDTSRTAATAPVMVSLIDSAGERHVVAPPRPNQKPVTALAQTPVPPALQTLESAAPIERVAEQAPASSITLPRFDADYLNNPPPVYPPFARRLGEQGTVLLRARVRADGTPDEVSIHRSSGSAHLDQAALKAVRQWRFIPARRGGTAVAAPVLIPISFTLQG